MEPAYKSRSPVIIRGTASVLLLKVKFSNLIPNSAKYPSASAIKIGAKLVNGELLIFNVTSSYLIGSEVGVTSGRSSEIVAVGSWVGISVGVPPHELKKMTIRIVAIENNLFFIGFFLPIRNLSNSN